MADEREREQKKCKECHQGKDENPAHRDDYTGPDKHVFITGETSGPGREGEGDGDGGG